MPTFVNSDGLVVHVGAPDTKNDGASYNDVPFETLTLQVNFNDLPSTLSSVFHDSDSYIPRGAVITRCLLIQDTAWVGGTSLSIGTYQKSGTAINATGLANAILTASLTAGSVIALSGTQAVNAMPSATLDAYVAATTAGTFTAGRSRLVIEYVNPRTLIV